MIEIEMIDEVRVLRMSAGENQFNHDFVTALADALDDAAEVGGPVVLTGTEKFFCNGLDLSWMGSVSSAEAGQMLRGIYAVLARLLRFPGATVAAINGHAFGAGAILAAAADFRVQRSDRGYFCFPEVDLGMSLSDEFDAVVRSKLPAHAVLHALLTGHRYKAPEALEAGFVDAIAPVDELMAIALGLVRDLVGKTPATVRAIKAQQHRSVLAVLDAGG